MNNRESIRKSYKVVVIIWSAFLISLIMYFGIVMFLGFLERGQSSEHQMIFYVFFGFSMLEIAAIPFVKMFINNFKPSPGMFSPEEIKLKKKQKYMASSIVSFAISESVALYGFTLAFIGCDKIYFYILIGMGCIAMIANFPSSSAWDRIEGGID